MPPRNPKGIPPLVKHGKAYEKALRSGYYDPFIKSIQRRLATAEGVNQAYVALRAGIVAWEAQLAAGIPLPLIIEALARVNLYNRHRLFQTFRKALAVDIRPFLSDAAVQAHMTEAITANVNLVKTIPPRFHESLRTRINQEFMDAPFDQQRLRKVLAQEYKSSGYNLRRLTRDQTQKLNANLSQMRQQQAGVEQYEWKTSEDERVRPTHSDNNGRIFDWSNPPGATGHPGHDVMCRCYANPVLTPANRQRLSGKEEKPRT